MDEIYERLRKWLKDNNIKQSEFAEKLDSTQAYISAILNGRRNLGPNLIDRVVEAYPEIDKSYLLYGDLVTGRSSTIPLYDVESSAGYGSFDEMINENEVVGEFVIPTFSSAEWLIYVKGSSMYPKYSSGDIIACRQLRESKFIQWNKVYVLATKEQGLLVKRLMPGDNDNFLKAVSDNPDYPSFDVPKDEIFGIALVLGVIRLE